MCLNPKDIPPDDLDDVMRGRMVKEAVRFYKMELEKENSQIIHHKNMSRYTYSLTSNLPPTLLINSVSTMCQPDGH